jgi:hypothetical protein
MTLIGRLRARQPLPATYSQDSIPSIAWYADAQASVSAGIPLPDQRRAALIEFSAEALIEADCPPGNLPPGPNQTVTLGGGLTATITKGESDGESDSYFLVLRGGDGNAICTIGDTALAQIAPMLPIAPGHLFQLLAATDCVETGLPFVAPAPPHIEGTAQGVRVASAAEYYVGRLQTANVPNTCGGHLACAWALNFVVEAATGRPVGGGLSTSRMFEALRAGRGTEVPNQTAVLPGDLIISPTAGSKVGHAGVVGAGGLVYSNSSSHQEWRQNYQLTTWHTHYRERLGLDVLFYRLS